VSPSEVFFAFIKKSRHGRDISLFKLLLIVIAGVPLPSEFGGTCNGRSSMSEIRRIIRDTKVLLDIVKASVDFSATSHKPHLAHAHPLSPLSERDIGNHVGDDFHLFVLGQRVSANLRI